MKPSLAPSAARSGRYFEYVRARTLGCNVSVEDAGSNFTSAGSYRALVRKAVISSTCRSERPTPLGEPAPRGFVNRGSSVGAAAVVGSWGTPALKYSTTSRILVNEALWKKVRPSLS